MTPKSLGLERVGGIDGAQTVPCAEIEALWWALKLTKGPIWLYTDSQIVYDGWHGFPTFQKNSGAGGIGYVRKLKVDG